MKLTLALLLFIPALVFGQTVKKCYLLEDDATGNIVTVKFDYDTVKASVKGEFVVKNKEGNQLNHFSFSGKIGADKRIQPAYATSSQVLYDDNLLTDDSWFMGDMFGFQVITFVSRKKDVEDTKSTVWVLMQCDDLERNKKGDSQMKMPKALREKIAN